MTTLTKTLDNGQDVIDSRDVIARIEELTDERDALDGDEDKLAEFDESDEGEELKALKSLAEDAEGYAPDWNYGAALIRESYFVEYCQELLEDIGDLPKNLPHYIAIDWEKTAENIKVDYTEVDFDGVTYLVC